MQRAALKQKASRLTFCVMTATPILRTLTLTVYGDLDVSIIDQPPGRVDQTYLQRGHERPLVCETREKTAQRSAARRMLSFAA